MSVCLELLCILFRVLMLGSADVGKSSLCSQILSSENINTYDTVDSLNVEKEVVVEVDKEASNLVFIDRSAEELEVRNASELTINCHDI